MEITPPIRSLIIKEMERRGLSQKDFSKLMGKDAYSRPWVNRLVSLKPEMQLKRLTPEAKDRVERVLDIRLTEVTVHGVLPQQILDLNEASGESEAFDAMCIAMADIWRELKAARELGKKRPETTQTLGRMSQTTKNLLLIGAAFVAGLFLQPRQSDAQPVAAEPQPAPECLETKQLRAELDVKLAELRADKLQREAMAAAE